MLIETPRLLIRALKASDLPDFTKSLADPEVMRCYSQQTSRGTSFGISQ